MKRLLVRFGESHRQYRRQREAFAAEGMYIEDAGAFALGSKARHGIIPDTSVARELAKRVGITICREQWAHLSEPDEFWPEYRPKTRK